MRARDRGVAEDDVAGGVLLDGFPRNVPQAAWLDGYLAGRGTKLAGVGGLVLYRPLSARTLETAWGLAATGR